MFDGSGRDRSFWEVLFLQAVSLVPGPLFALEGADLGFLFDDDPELFLEGPELLLKGEDFLAEDLNMLLLDRGLFDEMRLPFSRLPAEDKQLVVLEKHILALEFEIVAHFVPHVFGGLELGEQFIPFVLQLGVEGQQSISLALELFDAVLLNSGCLKSFGELGRLLRQHLLQSFEGRPGPSQLALKSVLLLPQLLDEGIGFLEFEGGLLDHPVEGPFLGDFLLGVRTHLGRDDAEGLDVEDAVGEQAAEALLSRAEAAEAHLEGGADLVELHVLLGSG